MTFSATKAHVSNRGAPPDSFLTQLVEWGRTAGDEIFAPNPNPADIYALIKPDLATQVDVDADGDPIYRWDSLEHRRAAMLEAMRVHAGFESSWNWCEGVDITNAHSVANPAGQETGAWQVSFDSTFLKNRAMQPFAIAHDIGTAPKFIAEMKAQHSLACEYYSRLVRVSIAWAGPLIRREINPWLSRAAVAEFQALLN